MAHRSRAHKPAAKRKAPHVITDNEPVYAYTPAQLAQASQELQVMAKEEAQGRRVNADAGDMRVTHVMHRKHYFNAIASGEDPRRDESYRKDMIKRGCIVEVPVTGGAIRSRPLSAQGRANYAAIFGKRPS